MGAEIRGSCACSPAARPAAPYLLRLLCSRPSVPRRGVPPPTLSPQPRQVSQFNPPELQPKQQDTWRYTGHRSEGRKASGPVMELGGVRTFLPLTHAPAWAVPSAANACVSVCLGLRSPRRLPLNLFVEFPDANLLVFFPAGFASTQIY